MPPSEAKALSMWEYEALLWNWNDAHDLDADASAPDPEVTQALLDKINADPRLTGREPAAVN
ncbi:MAG: hypothetical protein ACR652_17760 [Methylocystis sp.]|uniref:hypothetical protein n=1 Tax=Methylocystis sp. TaxID=1911079 RepID=UPI003DA4EB0D